jgi:hypothetical protein
MILEERAETHRQKFVIGIMIDKMGEVPAIAALEKAGIVHTGYRLETTTTKTDSSSSNNIEYNNETCISLVRDDYRVFLQPRKQIRLIVKENGIPLLACTSASGGVKEIDGKRLIVDFRTKTMAKGAINILSNNSVLKIKNDSNKNNNKNNNNIQKKNSKNNDILTNELIIIPDEINLTKRLLEPLHKFHKLAADILIPTEYFGISDNDSRGGEKGKNEGVGGNSI